MPNPTVPTITGQAIVTLAQTNLGGLANAVTGDQLLSFINEGKDEVWAVIKQAKQDFFVTHTQTSTPTDPDYFAPLVTNTREYTLPAELRDIQFIEILGPSSYERIKFTRRSILHPEFRDARTAATAFQAQGGTTPLTGVTEYFYDVVGKNQLVMAQYPEVAFTVQIWYVKALPEISLNSAVDEIVFPFNKKIADYAVMKIMLLKDPAAWAAWKEQWRNDLITIVQGLDRHSVDPIYAADFMG